MMTHELHPGAFLGSILSNCLLPGENLFRILNSTEIFPRRPSFYPDDIPET
jgi:hypothetical protein